jgi:PadR family transcriptional regulator, regulatory protein AphA
MTYQLHTAGDKTYLEALPEAPPIASEREALDWVASCGESGTHRLLLHASNLSPDFYNLKTGLAGAVLLKFVIYSLRVAAVLAPELVQQGKFHDFVIETNRGRDFRVFYDTESAAAWLVFD